MSDPDRVSLKFKGSGSEYFAIWIVNVILSALTLGIYSAWAKVRTKRYLYGNTSIDDASFEYHADPITILKGRLIAFALLFVYFVFSKFYPLFSLIFIPIFALVVPWVIWRSIIFNAKMSSIRNVRFGFRGDLKGSYLYYLVVPFSPILLFLLLGFAYSAIFTGFPIGDFAYYLERMLIYPKYYIPEISITFVGFIVSFFLTPYVHKLRMSYYINNMYYGQGRFSTNIFASRFYLIDIVAFLIPVGVVILVMTLIYMAIVGIVAVSDGLGNEQVLLPIFMSLGLLLVYLLLFSTVLLGKAYFTAQLRKYVYANTKLDDSIGLGSDLNIWHLFWIYLSNFLLLIFTLGFAYPWTVIRTARYMVETVSLSNAEALSQFVSEQQQQQSALGEEMVDAFDVDIGIDF